MFGPCHLCSRPANFYVEADGGAERLPTCWSCYRHACEEAASGRWPPVTLQQPFAPKAFCSPREFDEHMTRLEEQWRTQGSGIAASASGQSDRIPGS